VVDPGSIVQPKGTFPFLCYGERAFSASFSFFLLAIGCRVFLSTSLK
jgi:hypothetical protein